MLSPKVFVSCLQKLCWTSLCWPAATSFTLSLHMTQTHCVTEPTLRKAVSSFLFSIVLTGFLNLFLLLKLGSVFSSAPLLHQSCQIPLLWMFRNRIPVARTSIADELLLPGDRQHAQETDLITGWTLNKDCKTKHEVLEAVSLLEVVVIFCCIFSRWVCRWLIPVVVKTPALCSKPGGSWHSFHLKKKKTGRMGKSWATAVPVAQHSCVVPRVCRSAVAQGSLCGTCCGAGGGSPPSCRWLTATPAHPGHAGPTWLIPTHTAALFMESQCPGPSAEQKPEWFNYFFSSNKPNQRFSAISVLQNTLWVVWQSLA